MSVLASEALHILLHRRSLVRFHPKRIPHAFTDILIIGGGIAGLRAALEVESQAEVTIITKDVLQLSNSAWAQGGIAGALDPLDDIANHFADTMAAGKGLCDPAIVELVVRDAPEQIRQLIEFGTHFDIENGQIALTKEGGHSHRRVVHALGDATGKEIMRALIARIQSSPLSQIWEETFTIDLLVHEGVCRGALVWNPRHGRTFVWAKQTILATGGAGRIFRETTNPKIATGDGHAIAFRAGAVVRDMEFMQFHPTVLYIAGSSRHLISEAVRGEGGYLRDCHGYRFMGDYDPARELAPRDVVSRAITSQMALTKHPCVYLDLSHLPASLIRERFPHIGQVCADFGLDITKDRIPVRPGAHYMIGGVEVDAEGRTSVPGLWAAGEVTSSGLHGANRLASNSLLEGLVFGQHAGRGALEQVRAMPDDFRAPTVLSDCDSAGRTGADLNLLDVSNSLASEMGRNVGIERDAAGLEEAAHNVEFWDRYVTPCEFSQPQGWELQNLLLISRLMIAGATARKESRGVHFRRDFPQTDPQQARHLTLLPRI
ncbi:MAG: L-aspartate oxidase [Planctomycetaceae bacterium]|nr:L-aspartate oxidase [Planctomycetaceae bacterium]